MPTQGRGLRGDTGPVIGDLEKVVLDCADPPALAAFYCAVLGMHPTEEDQDWVVIGTMSQPRAVAFQRSEQWQPPVRYNPDRPQQLHLDIRVKDPEEAQSALVALGAVRAPGAPETGCRVFLDPAGHPFCIVFG